MKDLHAFSQRRRATREPARKPWKKLYVKHLGPSYVSKPFPTSKGVEGAAPWLRSSRMPLAGRQCRSPTASRASRHRLHNADSGPAFPDSSPLPRARHRSPEPHFLCLSLSRGQKQAEAAAPCSRDTRPGHPANATGA